MKRPTHAVLGLACCLMMGCGGSPPVSRSQAQEFLRMYEEIIQRLETVAAEAEWKASTDVSDQNTGQRIGAERALAVFQGSRYVIENSRRFLASRQSLNDIEFRELDKILLNAAESPGTIPEIVRAKIETEARLSAILDGFTFCLESQGDKCLKPITPNRIDDSLLMSRDLRERLRVWEASKQTGPALKKGLVEVRNLRNRVATELGYSSYFHLQVADYGMSVSEMMQLMDKMLVDTEPLYRPLHLYARRLLAQRYKQPVPEQIPAHWLPNRWGQEWPGLAESVELDDLFRGKSPEWIVQQSERFYRSLGWPALPRSFWEKSDLYQLPPGSTRKKNTHASAWHIDYDRDVRSLMSVTPNFRWFETSHHELGHVYYYLAYSNPRVPVVLRGGANRAFHEAVGDLIGMAARQQPYLREIGILPADRKIDSTQWLLDEALDSAIVFLPFSAGTVTHFEHDLYEKRLPPEQFNRRWWALTSRYQGILPPAPRGEQFCDACTKTHVIDDAAQYYDYALAYLIKYQLHDYIARNILHQDPHNCNYYGNKEVGKWLWEILRLGATRDWRQVIREKTGEDISSRALVEYFRPLREYLKTANAEAQ
ncbi:MAG: peptidase [Acidobacteriales bacterium]|nr:MAG: peptidase [Terriglobales bacterium]